MRFPWLVYDGRRYLNGQNNLYMHCDSPCNVNICAKSRGYGFTIPMSIIMLFLTTKKKNCIVHRILYFKLDLIIILIMYQNRSRYMEKDTFQKSSSKIRNNWDSNEINNPERFYRDIRKLTAKFATLFPALTVWTVCSLCRNVHEHFAVWNNL